MNFFAVGFVAVLGVVGVGVDYQQQCVKAGLPLGQMPFAQYKDTYEARFLGAKAAKIAEEREKQRQLDWKSGGIKFLPEAPEGWTRRKYSEASNTAIMPDTITYYEEMAKNGTAGSIAENLKSQNAKKNASNLDKTSWVYERGNEAVYISLRTKQKVNDDTIGGMIGLAMGSFYGVSEHSVRGYGMIGGVGFVEMPQRTGTAGMMAELNEGKPSKGGFDRAHFRRLLGVIGFNQEIEVTVHANAEMNSVLEVLGAVDWDGLNSMLETPMALVGNDVVLPPELDPQVIPVEMLRHRNKFNELRATASDFKLMNLNEAAVVLSMYSGGAFDITGGAVPDLAQLIEMGFRKEMNDLVAGRPSTGEYQRIRAMMVERPESERDVPKGEMSDALREELMGGVAPRQDQPATGAGQEHDRGDIAPQGGAGATSTADATSAAGQGGGIIAGIAAMFKGGDAGQGVAAAQVTKVEVNRTLGSSGGVKTGGCGAGQFCKAGE